MQTVLHEKEKVQRVPNEIVVSSTQSLELLCEVFVFSKEQTTYLMGYEGLDLTLEDSQTGLGYN